MAILNKPLTPLFALVMATAGMHTANAATAYISNEKDDSLSSIDL